MNQETPPITDDQLVKGAAVTAKVYVLAVLDEIQQAVNAIRVRYVADLNTADPFRALLASTGALAAERDRAAAPAGVAAERPADPGGTPTHPRPHDANCHADERAHWTDCECWCHDARPILTGPPTPDTTGADHDH